MDLASFMDKMTSVMLCEDSSCCCFPKRGTVIVMAIINFFGCLADLVSTDAQWCCRAREYVASVRRVLVAFFQMANLLLLLASFYENVMLVDIYVWYSLGYVVLGFVVTILEFVVTVRCEGARGLIQFIPEVAFLFVIFRCLPLVDMYRRHLHNMAALPPSTRL